jgi:hypothetical protein
LRRSAAGRRPLEVGGVGELHAAFLNESRTRGTGWRRVQEIRVSGSLFAKCGIPLRSIGDFLDLKRKRQDLLNPTSRKERGVCGYPEICGQERSKTLEILF